MTEDQTNTISEKTKLPMKFVIPLCAGVVYVTTLWYSLQHSINETIREVRDIKSEVWYRAEHAEWTRDLQVANPTVKVPIVSSQFPNASSRNRVAERSGTSR